jgi:Rieske Fe-S protein
VGGAAFVQAGPSQFLIARTGSAAFTVLTAICTHEMCAITGFADTRYVCPCHGSTFDRDGRVLVGPATAALRSFPSTFAGTVLVVAL